MFKAHELVVEMRKKPKQDKNPNQMAERTMTTFPPRDPLFELRMLVEESAPKIFVGLIAYKAATTFLRAAEHVVVTKVK